MHTPWCIQGTSLIFMGEEFAKLRLPHPQWPATYMTERGRRTAFIIL